MTIGGAISSQGLLLSPLVYVLVSPFLASSPRFPHLSASTAEDNVN
jgi:hypothetical protein